MPINARRQEPTVIRILSHPILALAFVVAACTGVVSPTTTAPPDTTTTGPLTTTTDSPSTTPPSASTTTTTIDDGSLVLPPATETMPETWQEDLFIPYGDTVETLGTSLGGDGEGIQIGPDYGAQGPDGTWWFLDTAKLRLVQFSGEGEFLKEAVLEEDLLSQGVYFQYQLPRVLDSGMLVANRLAGDITLLLRARGEELDTVPVNRGFFPKVDDGNLLYGFSAGEDSTPLEVNPHTGTAIETEWFRTRTGDRFRITSSRGELRVELPDAEVDLTIPVVAGEVGGNAFFSVEAASGINGTLHLFLLGLAEDDESLQLAGYLTIASDGTVSSLEPMRDPFTSADPGSPSRLGVRPLSGDPWMMFIDEDGVRVFTRA